MFSSSEETSDDEGPPPRKQPEPSMPILNTGMIQLPDSDEDEPRGLFSRSNMNPAPAHASSTYQGSSMSYGQSWNNPFAAAGPMQGFGASPIYGDNGGFNNQVSLHLDASAQDSLAYFNFV